MEALVREIFRRTGCSLPDSTGTADTFVSGVTLTAVFAPGGPSVGGGEDVAQELQSTVEDSGGKWVAAGAKGVYTVIILTGALLTSPTLAKQVCSFISHPLRHVLSV